MELPVNESSFHSFYHNLVQLIPTGIFYADAQGHCLYVNKHWCEMSGLSLEEAKGENWAKALHPIDRQYISTCWYASARLCLPFKMVFRFQRTDDAISWVYCQAIPDLDAKGTLKGYIGTITDITNQKFCEVTEQNLKDTKEYFELGLASAEAGIWSWDITNNIITWDKCVYQLFGVPDSKTFQGYNDFLSYIHVDDRNRVNHEVNKSLSTINSLYNTEFRIILPDGNFRHIKAHGKTYFDKNNNPILMIGITWDITEQKENEYRLRQQQVELTDIARQSAVGEMASCLAHELNQPLTAIATYAQLCVERLLSENTSSDELANALQHIVKQSERAGSIIHRIKNFARQQSHYYESVDIGKLINESIELLDYEKTGKLPKLFIELVDELPTIYLDRTQIQQVIINLIRNSTEALQETNKNKKQIKIRACLENNNKIAVTIADNGFGIPKALQARIFEPYFTTKKTGLGIGLAICRSIIEAHGGQLVLCYSNNDKGTCFKFTLPLQ